jgi:hypothetical protein
LVFMSICVRRIASLALFAVLSIGSLYAVSGQTDAPLPRLSNVAPAQADAPPTPMSNQELVGKLNQLRQDPSLLDSIIENVRRRGINFPLTDGLLSLAATRSGNSSTLRRTLEEAERRRANPVEHALPNAIEANEVLAKTKASTLAATAAMPDYLVKQLIARSYSPSGVTNWQVYDRLSVAVSYRAEQGEQYKLLSVNGSPAPEEGPGSSFNTLGDFTSTGEFVTSLAILFADKSRTAFKAIDTDTLRGHRTIIYEYSILKSDSTMRISITIAPSPERATTTGMRGRIWIDRDAFRVLRAEYVATEVPADFPAKGSYRLIDYDWVSISENKYLLPVDADVRLEFRVAGLPGQSRNEIRFRNYQKFSTDVRVLEDDEVTDDSEPPANEQAPPEKPAETKPPE